MRLTPEEHNEMLSIIRPMYGYSAWDAKLGVGSFITMNFGSSIGLIGKSKRPRGEWYLWIYHCAWQFIEKGQAVVGSEDDQEALKSLIKKLEGKRIIDIEINRETFNTRFIFEDDICLSTFPLTFLENFEHWMIYTPDSKVLTAGPGLQWSYESSGK